VHAFVFALMPFGDNKQRKVQVCSIPWPSVLGTCYDRALHSLAALVSADVLLIEITISCHGHALQICNDHK
jgi:hypothetical protein